MESGYELDLERIRSSTSQRTAAILLNTPANPTGRVVTRKEVEGLAEIALKRNLWLIADESFEKMVYPPAEHKSLASLPEVSDRTITIQTFSKGYAMAGWRVGYLAGPARLVEAAHTVHEWTMLSLNPLAQAAAEAALQGPQDWVTEYVQEFQQARDLSVETLSQIRGIRFVPPEAGGSILLDVSTATMDADSLSAYLLTEHGLPLVSGEAFGAPGTLRFSFGADRPTLEEGLWRMARAMDLLRAG